MALSDLKARRAKLKAKPYRLHDGAGLALLILPSGVKSWQYRYRDESGKPQTITLGRLLSERYAGRGNTLCTGPRAVLSLSDARALCSVYRNVGDPRMHKAAEASNAKADAAMTFSNFSISWVAQEGTRAEWSDDYRHQVAATIRNHLALLEPLPVSKITAAIAAPVLAESEARAPHMYDKVRRLLRGILDDAVVGGLIPVNPLPAPRRRHRKAEPRHYPAVTALEPLGSILRAARAADPCKGIQRAHELLAFTAQRVGEITPARWSEFDLAGATWSIPRERMKRKDSSRGPHLVPIPPVLLAQLQAWRAADIPGAVYVCPAPRDADKHITPESIEKHYRNALGLAGKHSPHSWRSAFSTVCRDAGKDSDVVEGQLDHVVGTKVASAYDRAHRLELRRELMAWYEAQLITARDGATVHPIQEGTPKE